jgi:hypothetical protein
MKPWYLALCAAGLLPTGCATTPDPTDATLGYAYHDANHPNHVSSPSPQAIENARHGVWLWPPAENDRPG